MQVGLLLFEAQPLIPKFVEQKWDAYAGADLSHPKPRTLAMYDLVKSRAGQGQQRSYLESALRLVETAIEQLPK